MRSSNFWVLYSDGRTDDGQTLVCEGRTRKIATKHQTLAKFFEKTTKWWFFRKKHEGWVFGLHFSKAFPLHFFTDDGVRRVPRSPTSWGAGVGLNPKSSCKEHAWSWRSPKIPGPLSVFHGDFPEDGTKGNPSVSGRRLRPYPSVR